MSSQSKQFWFLFKIPNENANKDIDNLLDYFEVIQNIE